MAEMGRAEGEEQLVVFDLGREVYGVEIARVQEIIRMTAITRLPRAPEFVEGVINLRGKVIPVVDLKKRFGLEHMEHTKSSRIVVVEAGDQSIGMTVDGVSEVLRIAAGSIEPTPEVAAGDLDSRYIRGVAKLDSRLIILLDLDEVLAWKERALVAAA